MARSECRVPPTPPDAPTPRQDQERSGMPYGIYANVNNGKGQRGLQSTWHPRKRSLSRRVTDWKHGHVHT